MLACASTWCRMLFALLARTTLRSAEPTGPHTRHGCRRCVHRWRQLLAKQLPLRRTPQLDPLCRPPLGREQGPALPLSCTFPR
jgi:hypothetical protein